MSTSIATLGMFAPQSSRHALSAVYIKGLIAPKVNVTIVKEISENKEQNINVKATLFLEENLGGVRSNQR